MLVTTCLPLISLLFMRCDKGSNSSGSTIIRNQNVLAARYAGWYPQGRIVAQPDAVGMADDLQSIRLMPMLPMLGRKRKTVK